MVSGSVLVFVTLTLCSYCTHLVFFLCFGFFFVFFKLFSGGGGGGGAFAFIFPLIVLEIRDTRICFVIFTGKRNHH